MRTVSLDPVRVVYIGIFDFDKLYKGMRQWFVDGDYDLTEKLWKIKVPSPSGSDDRIRWEASKKVTGVIKFHILVYWHLYDRKEVEVIKEGKKKKLTKARIMIELNGILEIDYSNRWGGSKLMEGIQDYFFRYIWKKKWDNQYGDELFYTVFKVYTRARELLGMEAQYFRSKDRF